VFLLTANPGLSYTQSVFGGPFDTNRAELVSQCGSCVIMLDLVHFEHLLDADEQYRRGR